MKAMVILQRVQAEIDAALAALRAGRTPTTFGGDLLDALAETLNVEDVDVGAIVSAALDEVSAHRAITGLAHTVREQQRAYLGKRPEDRTSASKAVLRGWEDRLDSMVAKLRQKEGGC